MTRMLAGFMVALTTALIMFSASISYADGVVIPRGVKMTAFKSEMLKHGMDLSCEDNADGCVENNGNMIKVITYKPVSSEQLEWIKDAAFKTVRD